MVGGGVAGRRARAARRAGGALVAVERVGDAAGVGRDRDVDRRAVDRVADGVRQRRRVDRVEDGAVLRHPDDVVTVAGGDRAVVRLGGRPPSRDGGWGSREHAGRASAARPGAAIREVPVGEAGYATKFVSQPRAASTTPVSGRLNEWFPGTTTTSPPWRGGRQAEGVRLPLDDEDGDFDTVELVEPALLRLPRRVLREREAEHAGRARRRGGTARHPCARRAAAGDQREPGQLGRPEMLDDREPGGVELVCDAAERRRATTYGCSTSATANPSFASRRR